MSRAERTEYAVKGFSVKSKRSICDTFSELMEEAFDSCDSYPGEAVEAFYRIKTLDPVIKVYPSCCVTGALPLGVGWFDKKNFRKATKKKMDQLKNILIETGFKIEPIEDEKFVTNV